MGATILLVEDDDDVGLVTAYRLERLGYVVVRVTTLAEAKASIADVDLVLLDLNLPDSQGAETCQRLLNHWSRAPVIVLTATHWGDTPYGITQHFGAYLSLSKGGSGTFGGGLVDRIEEVLAAHEPIRETYELLGEIRGISGP